MKTTKKYEVTIKLITGYFDPEQQEPILKDQEFIVEAEDEKEAIEKAKSLDTSHCSVWESYATEIDEPQPQHTQGEIHIDFSTEFQDHRRLQMITQQFSSILQGQYFRFESDPDTMIRKATQVGRTEIYCPPIIGPGGKNEVYLKSDRRVVVIDDHEILQRVSKIILSHKSLKHIVTGIDLTAYETTNIYAFGIGSVEMLNKGGIKKVTFSSVVSTYADIAMSKENINEHINEIICPGVLSLVDMVSSLPPYPEEIQAYLWGINKTIKTPPFKHLLND